MGTEKRHADGTCDSPLSNETPASNGLASNTAMLAQSVTATIREILIFETQPRVSRRANHVNVAGASCLSGTAPRSPQPSSGPLSETAENEPKNLKSLSIDLKCSLKLLFITVWKSRIEKDVLFTLETLHKIECDLIEPYLGESKSEAAAMSLLSAFSKAASALLKRIDSGHDCVSNSQMRIWDSLLRCVLLIIASVLENEFIKPSTAFSETKNVLFLALASPTRHHRLRTKAILMLLEMIENSSEVKRSIRSSHLSQIVDCLRSAQSVDLQILSAEAIYRVLPPTPSDRIPILVEAGSSRKLARAFAKIQPASFDTDVRNMALEMNISNRTFATKNPLSYSELRFPITVLARRVNHFRDYVASHYIASDDVDIFVDFSPDSLALSLGGLCTDGDCEIDLSYESVYGLIFNDNAYECRIISKGLKDSRADEIEDQETTVNIEILDYKMYTLAQKYLKASCLNVKVTESSCLPRVSRLDAPVPISGADNDPIGPVRLETCIQAAMENSKASTNMSICTSEIEICVNNTHQMYPGTPVAKPALLNEVRKRKRVEVVDWLSSCGLFDEVAPSESKNLNNENSTSLSAIKHIETSNKENISAKAPRTSPKVTPKILAKSKATPRDSNRMKTPAPRRSVGQVESQKKRFKFGKAAEESSRNSAPERNVLLDVTPARRSNRLRLKEAAACVQTPETQDKRCDTVARGKNCHVELDDDDVKAEKDTPCISRAHRRMGASRNEKTFAGDSSDANRDTIEIEDASTATDSDKENQKLHKQFVEREGLLHRLQRVNSLPAALCSPSFSELGEGIERVRPRQVCCTPKMGPMSYYRTPESGQQNAADEDAENRAHANVGIGNIETISPLSNAQHCLAAFGADIERRLARLERVMQGIAPPRQ